MQDEPVEFVADLAMKGWCQNVTIASICRFIMLFMASYGHAHIINVLRNES